ADQRSASSRAAGGGTGRRGRRRGRRGGVVPVQVVQLHDRDEAGAVFGIGGVDSGQVGRESVRVTPAGHRVLVAGAVGEQLAVIRDAVRDVVVVTGLGGERDPVAVLVVSR